MLDQRMADHSERVALIIHVMLRQMTFSDQDVFNYLNMMVYSIDFRNEYTVRTSTIYQRVYHQKHQGYLYLLNTIKQNVIFL